MENKYYSQYRGIWYKYTPLNRSTISGIWVLSESRDDMCGASASYNGDIYRIDECFEEFFKLLEKWKVI